MRLVLCIVAALCGLAVLLGETAVDPVKLVGAGLLAAAIAIVVP